MLTGNVLSPNPSSLFQVVKYWPQRGQAGFLVWRYLFRRDDESPAPWTEEGKRLIEENGYSCIYPEGYAEQQAAREKQQAEKAAKAKGKGKGKGKGKKRKLSEDEADDEPADVKPDVDATAVKKEDSSEAPSDAKRAKKVYPIPEAISALMDADPANRRLWSTVRETPMAIKLDFTNAVEEHFQCATCQGRKEKRTGFQTIKLNFALKCVNRYVSA